MSKIVVHTETEGQWDVVCNKYNILKCSSWNSDREESCIFFSKGEYSPRRFYVEEGYKVISFKEWVDKFGYKVGDWVLLSNDAWGWGSPMENINNKIFQITRIDIKDMEEEGGRYYFGKEMTVGKCIVRLATPSEIIIANESELKTDMCENCNGEGSVMTAKLYPSGHHEVNETCDVCSGSGEIEILEEKQATISIEVPLIKKPIINKIDIMVRGCTNIVVPIIN